ncbi:MAG TPA: type IIL restriction-modification enzyme MmeI [Solirubrobacteraceae bacterium]|nr:type IIL restriction-modification enzyme MmeI [Solirubrobacteraceae bacterium]
MARSRLRAEDHHAEWLSLVETSGPFLTIPTLKRALAAGLDAAPPALRSLRLAHAEWRADPTLRLRWIRWVLDAVLELGDAVQDATDADPSHHVAEHGVKVRPTYVVRDRGRDGEPPVMLVHAVPSGVPLDRPVAGDVWSASPIDRAAELARASRVELALVTDGARWTLVWAREGETTGTCTWRAELWLEEPITLRAFVTLLGSRRFFAVPEEQALVRLLEESAAKQQEVADQLGAQVRRAVELLIATLDREDRDRHGALLENLDGAEVYRGATTVMMRLVFLFVAEERRLLPIDDSWYAETLAASTLRAQLQERADRYGEDPLERSTAAWHRVLALFRAVHGGIEHDTLRLPAYGGGLFDPDRFPFLEGRLPGSNWHEAEASPLPVDDRTMLHLLDALQTLQQGGARVLLSYQALDVEQIGHVYEGLLDHTAVRVTDTSLGLGGKLEPELRLGEIDGWAAAGEDVLVEHLSKATGRSASAVQKALIQEVDDERRARLRAACGNDDALTARVLPYATLLREDLRGDPLVFLAGALFVTQALDRRASGTYYTPRQLAEDVVRHTLDPVAYAPGPAEERDPAAWRLRPAAELLDLKVADIAMGSGAFLVASCRYLAARLLEAWEALGEGEWTAFGKPRADAPEEIAVPADPDERQQLAHRLISERCLYGVDRNLMAVEMAKLSLWLITLAKDRPFSFVDHALRVGDSLLGITSLKQLHVMHLDPAWQRQMSQRDVDAFAAVDAAVKRALSLRRDLEAFVVRDAQDADRKAQMLAEADEALDDARLLGDLVVAAALAKVDDADPFAAMDPAHVRVMLAPDVSETNRTVARDHIRKLAGDWLVETRRAVGNVPEVVFVDRHPFHWAFEFPEVWEQGGFDAIVGNPPFQGGSKITGALGSGYRDFLVRWLAADVRGSADLVAYFYLRADGLIKALGGMGLIATNTLAQGDTREVGLDQLVERGWVPYRAVSSAPWPGGANLEMATVWASRRAWLGRVWLDGEDVRGITSALTSRSRVTGLPHRLRANSGRCFIGSYALGMGFVLSEHEAAEMIAADSRNAQVVRPYLAGEDLTSRPEGSAARWIINFQDWSKERAREYRLPFEHVEARLPAERSASKDRRLQETWWRFKRPTPDLYRALRPLDRCMAITLHSKIVQPAFAQADAVYSHGLAIFAYDDDGHFGLLSSGFHWWWTVTHASTMRTDIRYTPTDCFETFVHPPLTQAIGDVGCALHAQRAAFMRDSQEGLTKTYNRVHDADERARQVERLRELHVELDYAVRDAYGWTDLDLGHDFHETKFGVRYTFAPVPRQEILDRLLELNHERYAEEVRQGLHAKAKPKAKRAKALAQEMTLGFDGV